MVKPIYTISLQTNMLSSATHIEMRGDRHATLISTCGVALDGLFASTLTFVAAAAFTPVAPNGILVGVVGRTTTGVFVGVDKGMVVGSVVVMGAEVAGAANGGAGSEAS